MRPAKAPIPSMQIAAEAAVWVSRLHGPHRSPQMERECLQWQALSDAHRIAFERCTATWEDVRGVSLSAAFAATADATAADGAPPDGADRPGARRPARRPLRWALASVALAVAAIGVFAWLPRGIATDIGERRVVVLDDGSRLTLNTDTRVSVDYSATRRAISLEHGEALFEVARDRARPFVVRSAGCEVTAIGTVFSVRHTDQAVAVTLIEGEVAVVPAPSASGQAAPQPVAMRPGERLRLTPRRAEVARSLDTPRIEQVTAWKRGEASFDNAPLDEALAEMNRYSRTRIVLGDRALADRRVSGVFHTGDNLAFAQAVAALHGLNVVAQQDRVVLAPRR